MASSSTRGVGIRCGVNWSLLERNFWAPPLVGGVIQGLVVVLGVACLCCSTGSRRGGGAVVRMSSREHAALSYQRYG